MMGAKENYMKKAEAAGIKRIVITAMFAAVLAVLSQITIPLPMMPFTLQTFAVALIGAVLSWKLAAVSVSVYIFIGAVGVPVFTGFKGGLQVLLNYTGGFIWGFIFMAVLCGIGSSLKNKPLGILLGIVGLAVCHLFGVIQYMLIMGIGFREAFFLVSFPFLIKDVLSVVLGFVLGRQIRGQLLKNGLL